MRSLPDPTGFGVFGREHGLAAGWTDPALRHAVRRHGLRRLRNGVFAAPPAPMADRFAAERRELAVHAVGAALANPVAVISGAATAALHDLPVWRLRGDPCMTVPPGYVGDIERAHLHRARMPAHHLERFNGVPTATVARACADIGREHGLLAALVTADAAVRRGVLDVDDLRRVVRDCRGWPGVRAARESIEMIDPRAESALESVSRAVLSGAVPTPKLQIPIYDPAGTFVGRPDFLWDEFGVVGEADGLLKYDDDPQLSLRMEKLRQEQLERLGLIVVRWTLADLEEFDDLIRRLRQAFARGSRPEQRQLWCWCAVPDAA